MPTLSQKRSRLSFQRPIKPFLTVKSIFSILVNRDLTTLLRLDLRSSTMTRTSSGEPRASFKLLRRMPLERTTETHGFNNSLRMPSRTSSMTLQEELLHLHRPSSMMLPTTNIWLSQSMISPETTPPHTMSSQEVSLPQPLLKLPTGHSATLKPRDQWRRMLFH